MNGISIFIYHKLKKMKYILFISYKYIYEINKMDEINKLFDCVVYHSPCPDGTCSAWVVQHYHSTNSKEIELFPCRAGCAPDKEIEHFTGKKILFVDICPSIEYVVQMSNFSQWIHIIDHHKTNFEKFLQLENIPENISFNFDMNFSGCQLTWRYFSAEAEPWFVSYIGDRDIWKFELPNTNEYFSGMMDENLMNIEGFQKLYENLDNEDFKINIYNVGKKALEFREKCIQNVLKYNKLHCTYKEYNKVDNTYKEYNKVDNTYKEYNIWLYSCTKDLTSDVGNRLMKYKFKNETYPDFTVGWIYDIESDEFWVSMRSLDDKEDVSQICKEFGGGGHRNAAGCTVKGRLRDVFVPFKSEQDE